MPTKILLDFDSTLTQLAEHMLETCNKHYGTTYTPDSVTNWGWLADFAQAAFVWGAECYNSREWNLGVPPQPDAARVVRALVDAEYEPYIVSDRGPICGSWIPFWLKAHDFPDLPVIISRQDHYPKARIAQELDLTIVIEDAPHNARALAETGATVYLLDKRYNRDLLHDNIVRVGHWDEIAAHLLPVEAVR